MATGDKKNNLRKLHSDLKKINIPSNLINIQGLSSGDCVTYLKIFDYLFHWHNPVLSHSINLTVQKPSSLELDNTHFLEGIYLVLRDYFKWKPPLTIPQFLSNGFVEKKIIMCIEIVKLVCEKVQTLTPKTARKQQQPAHCGLKMIWKNPKTPYNFLKTGTDFKKESSVNSKTVSNFSVGNALKEPSALSTTDSSVKQLVPNVASNFNGISCIMEHIPKTDETRKLESVAHKDNAVHLSEDLGTLSKAELPVMNPTHLKDHELLSMMNQRITDLEHRISKFENRLSVLEETVVRCGNKIPILEETTGRGRDGEQHIFNIQLGSANYINID